MTRLPLACLLALALGTAALAQPATTSGTTSHTTTGLAKPPAGTTPRLHKKLNHTNASNLGDNTPTLPQVALHPEATIGSPVPIAGPGGTARTPTGD